MVLTLDIVTPERRVLSISCSEVRAPGVLGGFGIRHGHTPFLSALEPGQLTYVAGGQEYHYAIGGGFLQVTDNRVTALADTAEASTEIDIARAQRAFQDATERLRRTTEHDPSYALEAARVRRAAARLNVAGK